MQKRLGTDFPAFLASYGKPPEKGLRVNTLKLSAEEFAARASFPLGESVPWEKNAFYIREEKPGADVDHFAGLYYLQEPSAMAVGELAAGCAKARVLDLCAAPGGKTTQLAAQMSGDGVLLSNEINYARAKVLAQNVERMGIPNCAVMSARPESLAARFPAYFDLILVDAPCSGEGMFKKEENAIPEWSEENVARCAARQREILEHAAAMLACGGRLIYSTCTFAEEEDEWQIAGFLAWAEGCGAPFAGTLHTLGDGRMFLVPAGMPELEGVSLLRLGVELGEWDGKFFKPAHALAMAYGKGAKRKVSFSRAAAEKYLRGETIEAVLPEGWCVVCAEGFPLGWGKCVRGVIKNHLPKGLRKIN